MTDDITKDQEKWRSHVYQMLDYILPRRVLNHRPWGKWDLGRPWMRWFEQFTQLQNRYNGPKTC